MYIQLDSLHRLIYKKKTDNWELSKCTRVAKYDKSKLKEYKVIMQDPTGLKAFGRWTRVAIYNSNNIGDAMRRWIMGIMADEYEDEMLTENSVFKILNDMMININKAIFISTLLNVNIQFTMPSREDIEELSKQAQTLLRTKDVNIDIATNIKTVALLTNRHKENEYVYMHCCYIDKEGHLKLKKRRVNINDIKKEQSNAIVKTKKSLKPRLFGRRRETTLKNNSIVKTKISLEVNKRSKRKIVKKLKLCLTTGN